MTRTKYLLVGVGLVLGGCTVSSETVQHGTTKYLLTQTQNQWADNAVLVSECEAELVNGACKPKGETKIIITSGKLPGVVSGASQSMTTLGSAALVRDGLIRSQASVTQRNQIDVRASTVNPK